LSAGGIVITPAAKWLLDRQGLEAGTPWLGAVFVLGVIPFTLWLVHPEPGALGWLPDGQRAEPGGAPPKLTGTPYREAVTSRFFLFVTIGYVLAHGSQVGGIQQLVKLVEERTTADTPAHATQVLAATTVVARLIGGRIISTLPMIPFTGALAALQMVAMIWLAFAMSTPYIFGAIILFGATIGNILMLQPLLIAERFGVRDYPKIYSRAQLLGLVGTAGGPLLLGWLHDAAGGYRASYVVAGVLSVAGAVAVLFAGSAKTPSDPVREEVAVCVTSLVGRRSTWLRWWHGVKSPRGNCWMRASLASSV
jgi:cyanate permease